ncbi:MAG: hypothetical protein RBG1_1C00001G0206 [candidate division Zixibacteria bacterium RBG-1]|nr:MAG: hypothetical protein RBG1_1C00001G0206 [candidate division Zixibacteria bacterium RBG-1]OGC85523.1 MAG: hypothetical protein A2V73_09265 [candidate division Zixibacteria bacterium RBG_19FT_COMBO_42_43]
MNKVFDFMAQDHDRLDGIFKEFREVKNNDLKKAKSFFHDFKIGLQKHIVWEEEILFPIFENKTGMYETGPTAVMRMEHRQIKDFLEKIHDRILKGETSKIDELEKGLIEVLTAHNQKEESILYPWIDDSLSETERENVFTQMKNLPPEKYDQCCQ